MKTPKWQLSLLAYLPELRQVFVITTTLHITIIESLKTLAIICVIAFICSPVIVGTLLGFYLVYTNPYTNIGHLDRLGAIVISFFVSVCIEIFGTWLVISLNKQYKKANRIVPQRKEKEA
jgi:hypothetical protein